MVRHMVGSDMTKLTEQQFHLWQNINGYVYIIGGALWFFILGSIYVHFADKQDREVSEKRDAW